VDICEREGRPFRIVPDRLDEGKDIILTRCRQVICRTGMQASDVRKGGYASWRRELHTRLLREEDNYFGLMAALILAEACKVKVEIKVS
jgi:hypothetical protein